MDDVQSEESATGLAINQHANCQLCILLLIAPGNPSHTEQRNPPHIIDQRAAKHQARGRLSTETQSSIQIMVNHFPFLRIPLCQYSSKFNSLNDS